MNEEGRKEGRKMDGWKDGRKNVRMTGSKDS